METVMLKFNSPDGPPTYRALPADILHPRLSQQLTRQDFDALTKEKMVSTPPLTKGHAGTDLWYTGTRPDHFYILQIKFEGGFFRKRPDAYYRSLCTFTPTFGVDNFDSWFCCDVEEYALFKTLNFPTKRLTIFGDHESVPLMDYLRSRGFPTQHFVKQ